MTSITHDEMRFLRREIINHCIHQRYFGRSHMSGHVSIVKFVRMWELQNYGQELRAYA